MKLRPIKIGQLTISPKRYLAIAGAFLILGIGIGATIASQSDSKFALFFCTILSIGIVLFSFLKK
jgi:hypothetical protein